MKKFFSGLDSRGYALLVGVMLLQPFIVLAEPREHDWYVGIAAPFQGVGFYKQRDDKVAVWNLTPVSAEKALGSLWGARFSVYTVYSTPVPARVGEYEFNLELSRYLFLKSPGLTLSGVYFGPMLMLQFHDQDSGASLGGPGVTIGYRGALTGNYWYRVGSYFAYHRYLFGPKEELKSVTGGSLSGGLFMGLTLIEIGTTF